MPRALRGRAPLDLLVDALLLERAGELRPALARVDAALEAEPSSLPARLLALRLRATLDPKAFLAGARGLPPDVRGFAAALAPAAVRAQYLVPVRAAAREGTRDEVRQALEAVTAAAQELGVALEGLAEEKARLVEEDAAAWEELLAGALRRGAEEDALLRLATVLGAAPRARPGARVAAALDALVEGLASVRDEAERRGDRAAATRALERMLRAEEIIFYDLDPERRPSPELARLVSNAFVLEESWAGKSFTLVLAAARMGTMTRAGTAIVRRVDVRDVRQRLQLHPRSRALRYLAVCCELRDDERRDAEGARGPRFDATPGLRAVLEDGLLDDLHPSYVADAYLELGKALGRSPGSAGATPFQEVIAAAREVRARAVRASTLVDAYDLEASARGMLGLGPVDWDEAVARFRARTAEDEALLDDEMHCLAQVLERRARTRAATGLLDEALADAEEAVATQGRSLTSNDASMRATLCRLLVARGDLARAREVVGERVEEGVGDGVDFCVEAVRLHLALGDRGEAARVLALGEQAHPGEATLAALRAELAR